MHTGPMLAKIKRALELCQDLSKVVVVLQMFDNCLYFSRAEDGSLTAAKKGEDDRHHIPGAAVLAPKEMQYQAFKQALPVLEAVKHLKKIVIAPLPTVDTGRALAVPTSATSATSGMRITRAAWRPIYTSARTT